MESQSAPVSPEATTQAGSIRARWAWAEPSVWTERMLTALETGVKGGKWFSLVDKVYSRANLLASWERVLGNGGCAGVDRITTAMFAKNAETHVDRLVEQLRTDTCRTQPIRRVWIPKPGGKEKRPLWIRLSAIGWFKVSNGASPSRVTAFVPVADARTRCVAATTGWWTQT